jgi:hypothetical protein
VTWVLAGITLAAVFTFFALAMTYKVITGKERLVYYHQEVAVMLVSALVLEGLRRPVLPYLDVTILGIGMFLACGRVGCLMAGCCHGKPHGWGVRYGEEHVETGFTPDLVGVRLFPVQLMEAAWVLCVVAVGAALILNGRPPGTALAWYTISYGLGRFSFEFMRGDAERPYHLGLSQPQWLSVILMLLVMGAELHGTLQYHPWHVAATGFLLICASAIIIRGRIQKTLGHSILHARHIQEVARAMASARRPAKEQADAFKDKVVTGGVLIGRTSLGIQISTGEVRNEGECIRHYTLSCERPTMTEETAELLAKLMLRLKHPSSSHELVGRTQGIFHLLIHPAGCNDKSHPRMGASERSVDSFVVNEARMNSL